MNVVEASRDLKALERYIPAFVQRAASQADSGLAARRRRQRLEAAVNPGRIENLSRPGLGGLEDGGDVPYAFELWIGHLGWLDQMSAGVQFTLGDLRPEEAHGLALLRRARNKFWQEHSSCPMCHSVNLRSSSFCGGCGQEFK
jgi:hypothetical protein